MKNKLVALLVLSLTAALIFSCGEDDPAAPKEDGGIEWPAMTERDDVIATVMLAYDNPGDPESIDMYEAALHSQFVFHLDPSDVPPGEPAFLTRAEDIAATAWIFENSVMLQLVIAEEGSWESAPTVDGTPCADCWQTEREYYIRAQFGDDETIYQSPAGRASVTVIAAPDEGDPGKWVIRAMYDRVY